MRLRRETIQQDLEGERILLRGARAGKERQEASAA